MKLNELETLVKLIHKHINDPDTSHVYLDTSDRALHVTATQADWINLSQAPNLTVYALGDPGAAVVNLQVTLSGA